MKIFLKLFLTSLILVCFYNARAQAPNISYSTPQTLYVGKPVNSLSPVNTGGSVPTGYNPRYIYFTTPSYSFEGSPLVVSSAGIYGFAGAKLYKTTNTGGTVLIAGGDEEGSVDGKGSAARFKTVEGMVIDAAGNLYLAESNYLDYVNCKIRKVTPAGVVTTLAKNLNGIASIAIGPDGMIYCYNIDGLLKITPSGTVSVLQNNFPKVDDLTAEVYYMDVDKSGNIFMFEGLSKTILKVTPAGAVSKFAGSGDGDIDGVGTAAKFGQSTGMAFDSKGVLWFSDSDNGKFKKVTPDGTVTTVAEGALYDQNNQISYTGFSFRFAINNLDNIVFFNNTAFNVLKLDGYSITGDLPEGLKLDPSGKITGTPTKLTGVTDVFVTATNASGKSTAKITLNVVAPTDPPVITSFSPVTSAAGNEITINGQFLLNTSAVTIGGKPATQFSVESSTVVRSVVPAGAVSGEVTITTPYGTAKLGGLTIIQPPVITALSALSGKAGDKITITGNNFNTTRNVNVGGYYAQYTILSDTQLQITLGAYGASGDVSIFTSAGSATYPGFTYLYPPQISTFTPSTAVTGSTVTITGKGFTGATEVKFGGTPASSFTVENPTTVKAVVGTGSSGQVTIVTPAGSVSGGNFFYLSPPSITSVSPLKAGVGSTVLINGNNLLNATVTISNINAIVSFNSSSQVLVKVPVGATSGEIKVTTSSGTATLTGFTLIPSPQITSFSPTTAASGERVTINGQNFNDITAVSFGGVTAQFVVVSSTVIEATVGGGANGNVSVRNPGGEALSAGFIYKGATVTGFSPQSAGNNETVTITGNNFVGATKVTFGGVDAQSFTVVSATEIRAVVGNGNSGVVSVTTNLGSGYLAGFSHPGPSINSISPSYAGPLSKTPVTITGKNFTAATSVKFGGVPAASFSIISSTTISATPANSVSGDVEVTTPSGVSKIAGFVWVQPPTISSFTPTSQKSGSIITITGSNFIGVTSVKLGDVNAPFSTTSPTTLTALVGAGASGDVTVSTVGGNVSMPGFVYLSPIITAVSPLIAGAGQTVTITGNNFANVQSVTFGGVNAASFTVVSPTEIKAVPGAGSPGTITITGPSGMANFSGFTFEYPAVLYSVDPKKGGTGTEINISGNNLANTSEVTIGGVPVSIISKSQTGVKVKAVNGATGTVAVKTPVSNVTIEKFDWIPAPVITSFNPKTTNIKDTVFVTGTNLSNIKSIQFGDRFGEYWGVTGTQIKLINIGGGNGTITINTEGGSVTVSGYTLIPPPVINSFTTTGSQGSAVVTINGKDFTNVTEVAFGGVAAKAFTVVSANVITATPGTGDNGDITVKTPGGVASISGYLYNTPPYITSFFPTNGTQGTLVTLAGKNFNPNLSSNTVFFGGVKGEVKSVSENKLEVVAPAGAGGLIMVVNTDSKLSAYSNLPFNIQSNSTSFSLQKKTQIGFGSQIYQVAVADFDNDGKPDIFAATLDSLIVLQNTGGDLTTSVYGKRIAIGKNRTVSSVTTGDVDGDGRIDILIGQEPSLVFLRNITTNGNIAFETKVFENKYGQDGITNMRDIDMDGRPDIAGGFQYQNTTKNGLVDFGSIFFVYNQSTRVFGASYADIDGDGRPDAVYGNSNNHWRAIAWQNKTVPGLLSSNNFTDDLLGEDSQRFHGDGVYLADFDGDGKVDVMQKSNYVYGGGYWVAVNKAVLGTVNNSSFYPFVKVSNEQNISQVVDYNGDGKADILFINYSGGLYLALNNSTPGNVTFSNPVKLFSIPDDRYFLSLTVKDIDGDGRVDLVALDNSGKLTIHHNSTGLKAASLQFPAIASRRYGDADFTLSATTGNTSAPITYTVDKPEVATVKNGVVHILKSGTVLISATQQGNAEFDDARIQQPLIIEKAFLNITADDKTYSAGKTPPAFTFSYSGFVKNETASILTKAPIATTNAATPGEVGMYDITPSGAEAANYDFIYKNGKLTITPANNNLKLSATNVTCKGQGNGVITINAANTASYTALVTGNNVNKTLQFASNLAIENLQPGTYNVCVFDAALPSEKRCFDLTITEPKDLAVYTSVASNPALINLSLAGGDRYQIMLNGVLYTTQNNTITLELARGSNKLEVTTDKECQGKVEKVINYSGNPIPYPNPFDNELYINVGEKPINADIKIYGVHDGLLKHFEQLKNVSGVVKLDVAKLKMGVYSVHLIKSDGEAVYKLIKQ